VFVVVEHGSRRLARVEVTAHPSAAWTLQQLREVVGFDHVHRYLIHDRDSLFAKHLDDSIRSLGLDVLKSPPRNRLSGDLRKTREPIIAEHSGARCRERLLIKI